MREALLAAVLSSAAAVPACAASPFDGIWAVVLTCTPTPDGTKGFTYRFDATVADGTLHGQNSAPGMEGFYVLDGSIRPDGSADLHAHGTTGNPDYALGRVNPFTPYDYPVQARFTGGNGNGRRMSGRPCDLSFGRRS